MLGTGFPSMVAGMAKSPEAEVSQSVMVTSPPVVVYVRSLRSAADRGRAAKRTRARNPVGCFMSPVTTTSLQEAEARDPASSILHLIPVARACLVKRVTPALIASLYALFAGCGRPLATAISGFNTLLIDELP